MEIYQYIGFSSMKQKPVGSLVDLRAAALRATSYATLIAKEDSVVPADWLKLRRAFLERMSVSLRVHRNFICVVVEPKWHSRNSCQVFLCICPILGAANCDSWASRTTSLLQHTLQSCDFGTVAM